MKKYIFLDIDGVLNTERNIKLLREQGKQTSDKYGFLFDPLSVANLASILYQTNAEIIISSTWKIEGLNHMIAMWKDRGLPGTVIDITPSEILDIEEIDFNNPDSFIGRGREIQQWLSINSKRNDCYIILDDCNDILQSQQPFLLLTNPRVGITKRSVNKAIEILNK